jgi:hypothetical protein
VRRVVGPVEIEQEAAWRPRTTALSDVYRDDGRRQRLDPVPIDRVLQPRERRLARQIRPADRSPPARELQQRIGP